MWWEGGEPGEGAQGWGEGWAGARASGTLATSGGLWNLL